MLLLNTQFFNSYWIIVFPRFTAKQLNEQHYLASIQIHEREKKNNHWETGSIYSSWF